MSKKGWLHYEAAFRSSKMLAQKAGLLAALLMTVTSLWRWGCDCGTDLADAPLFSTTIVVPANLILDISVEFPTAVGDAYKARQRRTAPAKGVCRLFQS